MRDTCRSNVSPLIDFIRAYRTLDWIGIDLARFHFDVNGECGPAVTVCEPTAISPIPINVIAAMARTEPWSR